MRFRKKILALASVGAMALGLTVATGAAAFAATCTTSADNGYCPGPGLDYTYPPDTWSNGSNTYINNNIFNHNLLPSATQTLTATDPGNWQVAANMANGNTAIISGPQVRQDLDVSGAPAPLSNFPAIYASSTDNLNANAGTDAEFGYDIWTAGSSTTNFSQEMMIWTDEKGRGTCGGASPVVSGVQFGGSNGVPAQSWNLCVNGPLTHTSEFIWWLPGAQMPSGAVDIRGMLGYLINHGYYPSTTGMDQIDQTFELASTGGVNETLTATGFALNSTGFAQASQAPAVVTNAASGVTTTGATLNGTVNPEGQATTWKFDYGLTTSYGTSVPSPAGSAGSGTTAVSESQAITGLTASTVYHYRIEATNATGTTFGADQTFTTTAASSLILGDSTVEANADSNTQGQAQAVEYTASRTGTSQTISFYVDPSSTATAADIGEYSNAGTDPGTLLKQVTFTPVPGWNTVTFTGVSEVSGTQYWLAELGVNGTLAFRDQGSGAYSPGSSQANLTALPATWVTGPAWHSGLMSAYISG